MAGSVQMAVVVRGTFIDIMAQQASEQEGARRRPRSNPPSVGHITREEELCSNSSSKPLIGQLARLDAIMQGDAVVQSLHGKAPASCAASDLSTDVSTALSPSGSCGGGASEKVSWASLSEDVGEDSSDAPTKGHRRASLAVQRSSGRSSEVLSAGSAGHALGTCRPCSFAGSAAGCKFGASCSFCHLTSEHVGTARQRPCKGKRDRIKKAMEVIERKVAENPEYLDSGAFFLPALVDKNPQMRARAMAQLSQVATGACRRSAS